MLNQVTSSIVEHVPIRGTNIRSNPTLLSSDPSEHSISLTYILYACSNTDSLTLRLFHVHSVTMYQNEQASLVLALRKLSRG